MKATELFNSLLAEVGATAPEDGGSEVQAEQFDAALAAVAQEPRGRGEQVSAERGAPAIERGLALPAAAVSIHRLGQDANGARTVGMPNLAPGAAQLVAETSGAPSAADDRQLDAVLVKVAQAIARIVVPAEGEAATPLAQIPSSGEATVGVPAPAHEAKGLTREQLASATDELAVGTAQPGQEALDQRDRPTIQRDSKVEQADWNSKSADRALDRKPRFDAHTSERSGASVPLLDQNVAQPGTRERSLWDEAPSEGRAKKRDGAPNGEATIAAQAMAVPNAAPPEHAAAVARPAQPSLIAISHEPLDRAESTSIASGPIRSAQSMQANGDLPSGEARAPIAQHSRTTVAAAVNGGQSSAATADFAGEPSRAATAGGREELSSVEPPRTMEHGRAADPGAAPNRPQHSAPQSHAHTSQALQVEALPVSTPSTRAGASREFVAHALPVVNAPAATSSAGTTSAAPAVASATSVERENPLLAPAASPQRSDSAPALPQRSPAMRRNIAPQQQRTAAVSTEDATMRGATTASFSIQPGTIEDELPRADGPDVAVRFEARELRNVAAQSDAVEQGQPLRPTSGQPALKARVQPTDATVANVATTAPANTNATPVSASSGASVSATAQPNSARTQAVQLQPVQLQPVQIQATQLQPVQLQPVQLQPAQVQPAQLQPAQLQPAQAEAAQHPVQSTAPEGATVLTTGDARAAPVVMRGRATAQVVSTNGYEGAESSAPRSGMNASLNASRAAGSYRDLAALQRPRATSEQQGVGAELAAPVVRAPSEETVKIVAPTAAHTAPAPMSEHAVASVQTSQRADLSRETLLPAPEARETVATGRTRETKADQPARVSDTVERPSLRAEVTPGAAPPAAARTAPAPAANARDLSVTTVVASAVGSEAEVKTRATAAQREGSTSAGAKTKERSDAMTRVEGFSRGARFNDALSAYGNGRGHQGAEHTREEPTEEREWSAGSDERATAGVTFEAPQPALLAPTPQAPRELSRVDVPPPALLPEVQPPPELPEFEFSRAPGSQPQAASISIHHPDLGPIEIQVQRRLDKIEVSAVIESSHAEAVLRANESGIRLGVQQSGMTFSALRVKLRGDDNKVRDTARSGAPARKRPANQRGI